MGRLLNDVFLVLVAQMAPASSPIQEARRMLLEEHGRRVLLKSAQRCFGIAAVEAAVSYGCGSGAGSSRELLSLKNSKSAWKVLKLPAVHVERPAADSPPGGQGSGSPGAIGLPSGYRWPSRQPGMHEVTPPPVQAPAAQQTQGVVDMEEAMAADRLEEVNRRRRRRHTNRRPAVSYEVPECDIHHKSGEVFWFLRWELVSTI